jgi:hypothetical protein
MDLRCLKFKLLRALVAPIVFSLSCPAFSQSPYISYQVQEGESLSTILYDKFKIQPVYGKKGYIHQVVWLNQGKILQKGDLISAGDTLLIPAITTETMQYGQTKPREDFAIGKSATQTKADLISRKTASESSPVVASIPNANANPNPEAEFTPFSKLAVSLGANYLGLYGVQTSNQSEGRILSGLSPSVEISWQQIWDKNTTSRVYLGAEQIQFLNDPSAAPITNASVLNSDFGLGLGEKLGSRVSASFDIETAQTLFYTGLTGGSIAINQVPILRLHPELELLLIKRKLFQVSLLGGGSYYGASSYDTYSIQSGYGYDAALQILQEFSHSIFDCKLGYAERRQNTTYLNLIEKDIGLNCGLSWGL